MIEVFLDESGKIKTWPSKATKKIEVLNYLATKFDYSRIYSEKEVNELINNYHTFNDYFLLRRELITHQLLKRTTNGSKYWKNDVFQSLETEHLIIRDVQETDQEGLINTYLSLDYMAEYTNIKHEATYIHKIMTEGDLPPNGVKEFYQLKTIIKKDTQKTLGFMEYYLGYPHPHSLWIASLFIHKDEQQKRYGTEIISKLSEYLKNHRDINELGIGVHLKNWQALRFWTKLGFVTITGVYGDKQYSPNHFSVMGLKQELSKV